MAEEPKSEYWVDKRKENKEATGPVDGRDGSNNPKVNAVPKNVEKEKIKAAWGHDKNQTSEHKAGDKENPDNRQRYKEGEKKLEEHTIYCPPGKDSKESLNAIATQHAAQSMTDGVKVKCEPKTKSATGGSSGGGGQTPAGATELPKIDIAKSGTLQGAGKSVTNPVDLQNKVTSFQGQQYFNPSGGLPSAPAGYSWQGTDYATLVNNASNTALSVAQTLALFNGSSQSSARGGTGTNPITAPTSSFGFSPTISTPFTPFTDTGKYIPSAASSRTGNAMGWAMDQLKREGVPEQNLRAAAAHLVGQAKMESGLDPTKVHDQGTGYGIYGARLGRRTGMFNWLDRNGFARDSLEGQVRYMAKESMNNPAYSTTRNILLNATPNNFASQVPLITKNFENPAIINYRTGAVQEAFNVGPGGSFSSTGAVPQTGIGIGSGGSGSSGTIATGGGGTPIGSGGANIGGGGGSGSGSGSGNFGVGFANAGGTPGGAAGGGSGSGMGNGGTLGLTYKRPQQEGQGGYIAQAAAATIAARTGGMGSLAANSLMPNMGGGGGGGLGGLASGVLGLFGGQVPFGSVSPNYNVPNWSPGDAANSGVSPMSSVGDIGSIPGNSASLFPTSVGDFSQVGNQLGSVPNAYTNLPTSAPLASTNGIGQDLGSAANQAGISQTPQGQFGQFGQSITGAGGGGGGKNSQQGGESKEQKSIERPGKEDGSTTSRAKRRNRKESNKGWDKKKDSEVPLPPKRPASLTTPLVQAQTGRKTEGSEGPENQSIQQSPSADPMTFIKDFSGSPRNLLGQIPGLEQLMMGVPNGALGSFINNMPAGLQSLLPQGLIPGLSQGPISLNNLLQLAGGGALGGAAGQMIRSMAGGIPVASLLTQSLQSVPITQVFGALGQDIGTSAAAIANTLGSITNVASRGLTGGIPVNSSQLNQAISYALASSGSALSVPINTLGVASQVTNNPIGSLVNIAMGGLIANGSVPIVPTNLSGTNAALLAGLNQKVSKEDAQMILNIGQITGLLPPNVRNLIPQVSPNAFGGPKNAVQNNRENSAQQTNPESTYNGLGGGGSRREFESVSKPAISDMRNINYGMKLSEHYTLYDLSLGVAWNNGCHPINVLHLPIDELVQNLMLLARNIIEPIREHIGPPTINSGYRGRDQVTVNNDNWFKSLHGYGRAVDLTWGNRGKIAQAQAYASACLHVTENLHEGRWHHVAVAGGTGGKGGSASTRTPDGNIQQGINTYKGNVGTTLPH